jgi:hypothetical protein
MKIIPVRRSFTFTSRRGQATTIGGRHIPLSKGLMRQPAPGHAY